MEMRRNVKCPTIYVSFGRAIDMST